MSQCPITAQLVGDYLPSLGSMTSNQPAEKPLGSPRIPSILHKYIDDIAILVNGAPQILLFSPDPEKDLVDIERISESPVFASQSPRELWSELGAPEADRLEADRDALFGQQVFNLSVAHIESAIQPNCIADDVGWETVALVVIHTQSLR